MIGLIAWFCLLAFFWCGMVLVLRELVLLYEKGVEFKGEIFSNHSRRVKWQCVTAGIGLSVYVLD